MRLNLSFSITKKTAAITIILLLAAASVLFIDSQISARHPVPANIREQFNHNVIYPSKDSQISTDSYQYQADKKTLSFKVRSHGKPIVFTQQPAPEELGGGTQAYYHALGLRPYAQFQTKLGSVALVKFWQSGNLEPAGQSAILVSEGTLLIATASNGLTNAQWKDLFETLKISK